MPEVPARPPFIFFSSSATFPTDFIEDIFKLAPKTAMPAESYPRYSKFLMPSMRRGAAFLFPMYPNIPHIFRILFDQSDFLSVTFSGQLRRKAYTRDVFLFRK